MSREWTSNRESWKCPRKFPRMNHFIVKMSHHRHLSIPFGGLVCWKNIPERLRDKGNCKEVDCTRWPALKEEVPSVYHCSENPHNTVTQRRILRKSEIKFCCVNFPTLAQKLMKSASSTWNKAERVRIKSMLQPNTEIKELSPLPPPLACWAARRGNPRFLQQFRQLHRQHHPESSKLPLRQELHIIISNRSSSHNKQILPELNRWSPPRQCFPSCQCQRSGTPSSPRHWIWWKKDY